MLVLLWSAVKFFSQWHSSIEILIYYYYHFIGAPDERETSPLLRPLFLKSFYPYFHVIYPLPRTTPLLRQLFLDPFHLYFHVMFPLPRTSPLLRQLFLDPFLCQQSLPPLSVCLRTRTQYRNCTPKNRQWSSPGPGWWKCFSACSFSLVSSLWHDRALHITSLTSWFRNTRHGPRLVFILPYKPHSVCQYPLLHIWASSHLFWRSGISPWTCPLHSLYSSSFYCNLKALRPSSLMLTTLSSKSLHPLIISLTCSSLCRNVLMTLNPRWHETNLN